MNFEREPRKVRELVDLYEAGWLSIDPKYQRGSVWKTWQKKQFVDSVLRGYPVPVLYFHHIHRTVAGLTQRYLPNY